MEKEIIERVNKITLNKLMEDVWPVSLCLMRDCYWIAFWEAEDIENAYTQDGSEDFEGFVKRVIASELENEKPDDDGFMYLNVDFAIAEAECNKALNPTYGSKREPEAYEDDFNQSLEFFNTYAEFNKWLKELTESEKELILHMLNEYANEAAIEAQADTGTH